MILPTKNIYLSNSLLGLGAIILENIRKTDTVSSLWERVHMDNGINTFEKYVLSLDLLYVLKAINIKGGIIIKND